VVVKCREGPDDRSQSLVSREILNKENHKVVHKCREGPDDR